MKHLTIEQRYQIEAYFSLPKPLKQNRVAHQIGISESRLSRELNRNRLASGRYKAKAAQDFHNYRQCSKPKAVKFNTSFKLEVDRHLQNGLSPEQISGRLKLEQHNSISHETIYKYIWDDKQKGGTLYQYLSRKQRGRKKRGKKTDNRGHIPNKISIEQRPPQANNRERFGDWEADTIIGANHKGAILTLIDRKTLFTKLTLLKGKDAKQITRKIIKKLNRYKPYIHTLTSDNGKEFSFHEQIAQTLQIQYFFTHPYSSYECGTVENMNGLIRRYIPKKTNFDELTHLQIKQIENQLNNRPRKKLGYYTPQEVLNAIFNPNNEGQLRKIAFIT